MTMACSRMILILSLLGGVATPVIAQAAASSVARFEFSVMATERMRDVGFAQLKPEMGSKPRPVAADYEIIPMRISSQGRSDLYTYEGPLPLRIVETAPAAEGEALRAVRMLGAFSRTTVPPRALLLLAPSPTKEGDLAVTLLDDSAAGFPSRHMRVVNLSGVTVAGSLGGIEFTTTEAKPILAAQRVESSVSVGVAYERRGVPTVVFDQSIRVGESERVMLVFLPPFRPGADVRVRVVRDSVGSMAVDAED